MDAFYLPLVAVLLAEIGGKPMQLAALLAGRFRGPGQVLAGIATATAANVSIAAVGGVLAASFVPHRGISLLLAVALLSGGIGSLFKVKRPDAVEGWRLSAFVTTALAFFILEFGDGTMFLAFAFAAHGGAPVLSGSGVALGVVAASVPAVLLRRMPATRHARLFAGALLILSGLWTALNALQVI